MYTARLPVLVGGVVPICGQPALCGEVAEVVNRGQSMLSREFTTWRRCALVTPLAKR